MILPTKHLREDQALIAIGADLLALLSEPKTVSRLWDELRRARAKEAEAAAPGPISATARNRRYSLPAVSRSTGSSWRWTSSFYSAPSSFQRGRIRRIAA